MIRAELLFVNLEGVQIIRLGRFLPPGFAIDQGDVVQNRPQVGVWDVGQARPGLERGFVITGNRFGLLLEVIADESETARGTKQSAIIGLLGLFQEFVRFDEGTRFPPRPDRPPDRKAAPSFLGLRM